MDEGLGLPDGSYSISDIQDHSEYIKKKKHGEETNNTSITIYINKTKIELLKDRILS